MDDQGRCAHCGARLGPEADPIPTCPACLMKLGLSDPSPDAMERVGPYRLLRRLGEGGMGEVWEADQEEPLRRKVALKLIKPGMDTRQVIARFDSERQALALMDHPSVARVFDAGSTPDGRPFFVMEYVDGAPITTYADRKRLSTRERLELFVEVCEGVQHAHQKGIIHRDIKPSNVLVAEHDGKAIPKIIDFGIAKATAPLETGGSLLTDVGQVVGTPEYMSPEQAREAPLDVDTRTDVYSLGILLYELLVGVLPLGMHDFRRVALEEIRRIVLEEVPSRPSARVHTGDEHSSLAAERRRTDPRSLARQLRGDLDWITLKALEKDRERRYEAAAELRADVERYLRDEPVLAGRPSLAYRARKFARRNRAGVATVLAAFFLLAAFATHERIQATRIAAERDTAERVTEFLVDLFRVSAPDQSRGETITAREILDRGAEKVETELADRPEVQGRLMTVLGTVYMELGEYDRADRLLSRSCQVLSEELGDHDPATLRAMHERSLVLRRRGQLKESEQLARETLAGFQKIRGDDQPETLDAMESLANALWAQDRLDEAGPYFRNALEGTREFFGPDHPETLASLNNYAGFLYNRGEYAESAERYRELLAAIKDVHGDDHPWTLSVTHNLGAALEVEGEFEEAEPYYRDALAGRRRVLGEDHPKTLMSKIALAKILHRQGRIAEAERLARAALEGFRGVLGDEHPNTLFTIGTLAWMARDRGDLQDAERLYRKQVDLARRAFGEEHRSTLRAVSRLAAVYRERGLPDRAAELHDQFPAAFPDEAD